MIYLLKNKIKNILKNIPILFYINEIFFRIFYGEIYYKKVCKRYSKDTVFYLIPCYGTGDIFIITEFLQNCDKVKDNMVLLTISNKTKYIAEINNFNKDIQVISERIMRGLLCMVRFYGEVNFSNIKIMHFDPYHMYTTIAKNMAGYKSTTFYQFYDFCVFNKIGYKKLPLSNKQSIDNTFEYYNFPAKKMVLIFPKASTIECIDNKFWEILAQKLIESGMTVCTNIVDNETPIKNTVGVSIPYSSLLEFANKSGIIIGLRSGIFDIIAQTDSYKYIIYPQESEKRFGVGSFFDFFNFSNCHSKKNVYEYCFDRKHSTEIIEKIYQDIMNIHFNL